MIGDRMKVERKARGWSMRELAQRSGISEGYLWLVETNRRSNPTRDTLKKLAGAFEVTVDALLTEPAEDIATPPVDLLRAAGEWTEARELELWRLWPAFTPNERRAEVMRLERLARINQEIADLHAELDRLKRAQQQTHRAANGTGPLIGNDVEPAPC